MAGEQFDFGDEVEDAERIGYGSTLDPLALELAILRKNLRFEPPKGISDEARVRVQARIDELVSAGVTG